MSDSSRLPHRLAVALVFVAALLCCLPAVDTPFTFDEQAGIEDNRVVHPGAPFGEALRYRYSPDQARPVFFGSLLLDANLWGLKPRAFRLTGFLLHLACGAILYLLLRRPHGTATVVANVVAPGAVRATVARAAPAALAGTALFLLHPLQSESVLYIWGRSEILSTLFGLLAILLALAADDRKPAPGTGRRYPLWAGAVACMALALASKEEAVAIPVIFYIWWRWAEGRPARPGILSAAVLGLPVVLFLLWRGIALGEVGRQVYARSVTENVLGQSVVTLRMLRLFFLPFSQSIDHPAEVPRLVLGTLAMAACVFMIGWALYAARTPAGAAAPIAAGVLVAAAGTALYWIVPLPDLMCERRAYLPLVGAALAMSGTIQRLRRRTHLAVALILLLLAPAMAARARVWSDPNRLWGEAARLAPLKARPLINLGVMAAESGDRGRALDLFNQAIRLEPSNAEALFNRGKLHRDAGRHAQAVADLRAAISSSPGMVKARINLAIALMDVHDLTGAETELRAALEIEPRDPRALTNLGEVLRATGRAQAAVTLYREALDADPTYSHAAARLGVTLENLGDRRGALAAYREFLARGTMSPTDREAVLEKVKTLEQASGATAPDQ